MNAHIKIKKANAAPVLSSALLLVAGTMMIMSLPAQAQDWTQRTNQSIHQNPNAGSHYGGNQNWQRPPAYNQGRAYNSGRTHNPGRTQGKRNARRINKIINGLTPAHRSHRSSKGYRRKIRRVVTWRKGHKHGGHSIVVNYNHSVDLSVFFKFNSSQILPQARPVLDDLGYALNSPKLRFARYLIAGHTDSRGARGYNQWLSDERARSVANYLIYNFNIAPHRLLSVGFGEELPANRRRPKAAVNRRVEVSLIETNQGLCTKSTPFEIRKYKFTPLQIEEATKTS